jgi:hypothetical protein
MFEDGISADLTLQRATQIDAQRVCLHYRVIKTKREEGTCKAP